MAIENADYFVYVIDFPVTTCGGMTILNEDGTYSVYVNARLSADRQAEALKHELMHIDRDDLFCGDVGKAENF